ncbi:MAG: UPF0262 family protein [Candidatus Pacebacteria bacterium]|nr:UPF0262 family protein [Candidatus Paceibacterota bacterium]
MSSPLPAPHIAALTLDEHSVLRRSPEIEHERTVAITDLLAGNYFVLVEAERQSLQPPYNLHLSLVDDRLLLEVSAQSGSHTPATIALPMSSFRRLVRDYFMICDSYFRAVKSAAPHQIETIDMARRGIHTEGATLLTERLAKQVTIDSETARRLFTLICVLHLKANP